MWSGRGSSPLEVNRPIAFVYGNNLSGIFPSSRITGFQRPVDGVVLRRKAVPVDYRPLDASNLSDIDEPAEGAAVFLEFIVAKIAKPEIFPPSRFFLSPMPFQHLRKNPKRPLLIRPLGLVCRE